MPRAKGTCRIDLMGQRFGALLVVGLSEEGSAGHAASWVCKCDCGTFKVIKSFQLRRSSKPTRSCGCLNLIVMRKVGMEHPSAKHGHALCGNPSPEYRAWLAMWQRCTNTNQKSYKDYGGRGIKVCSRWRGKTGFQNFLRDVGCKPTSSHTLDRFPNNNGNYEPGNVRWATRKEQRINQRPRRMS